MNCPRCNKKIDYMGVSSFATQNASTHMSKGKLIIDSYDSPIVGDTVDYYCVECGEAFPVILQEKIKRWNK